MAGPFDARFFDGKTAASRPARVTLAAQGLVVEVEGGRQSELWHYRALHAPQRLPADGGLRVTTAQRPDAQLVVGSTEFRDELLRLLPRYGGPGRWRRHKGEILLVTAIVLFVAAALVAIPRFARPLAEVMPASWEDKLGEAFERHVIRDYRVCDAEAGTAALDKMLKALPYEKRYDGNVSVRVVAHPMVNAFAAPGGRIVLMRGLIKKARSPDEVAGILAHELGHVVEHHPTANAIRVLGVMTLLDVIMGDSATVLESLSQAGGMLLLFAQNRRDEARADAIALELLAEAGIDSAGLADFFARLDRRKTGDEDSVFSYLSTHPLTASRQRRAREAAGGGHRPALDVDDWRALKAICEGAEED